MSLNNLEYDLINITSQANSERKNLNDTKLENVLVAESPKDIKRIKTGQLMISRIPQDYFGGMNPMSDEFWLITKIRSKGKETKLYIQMSELDDV